MLAAQGQAPVNSAQGEAVAREIGARYMECSAKTGTGVKEVFEAALRESARARWSKGLAKGAMKKRCLIV